MLKRNLWKLILSVAIALWAVSELIPVRDIPFATYAVEQAGSARAAEFRTLMAEATGRVQAGTARSEFVALKQIGTERNLDLSQFFPDLRLEAALTNIEKRNDIILDELLRRSKSALQLGLDLKGGVAVTLEVDPAAAAEFTTDVQQEKLSQAIEIIGERIDRFGVTEPIVRAVGDARIEIQMPGLNTKDDPGIIENVRKPARLEFRRVHPTLSPANSPSGEIPANYEVLSMDVQGRGGQASYTEDLFVRRFPDMSGEVLSNAWVIRNQLGQPEIIMEFTSDGRDQFAAVTRDIVREATAVGVIGRLAIVLDGTLYSAPTVREEIDSPTAQITGSFTDREALSLANVLNNPLDLPLVVKEQYEVGASLAEDAISSGVKASIIGAAAVCGFMLLFYSTGGLVAVASLALNILIILGVLASFNATLTLPGIAGIVLTIGMAVDANILIFERMREELALGKNLATANQGGFQKALTTIIDAHLVQLIICGIMISLGTGPIKGFGVTLAIGVISTLISVLITAHMVMEFLLESGWVKRLTMRHLLKNISVDFIKYGKPAFISSWLVVLLGIGVVLYKGSDIYGIDFAGGDEISLQFTEQIDLAGIREAAAAINIAEVNPSYTSALGGGGELLKIATPEGQGAALAAELEARYPNAGLTLVGTNQIGASIGREVQFNALLAVGVSMLATLLYIAFRFEFGFGIGAMFASFHDILMTVGIFVLFGHQFSAPMVAAILAVAGYSINETVVVFDRIREELKLNPTASLREIVNSAINKVFARTIMTATTTLLAAFALFLFGGGVLRDISFTFIVGIMTATFSAIFVASQVFYFWHKGDRKHVEAHRDIAPKYEWQGASKASE